MKTDTRIPVTIITGFLGAGKTTLLNNIIRKHPEKRFAIIENEFGEIGIDGGLIVNADNSIFELSNGCICCTMNSDFNEVIDKLLDSEKKFDYLLIETTGIADPGKVAQSFLNDGFIQHKFRLDGMVCLADAVHMESRINSEPEIRKQLALSDIVLLNKTENVEADQLEELQKTIAIINPSAEVHRTIFADITEIPVLDTFSYSGKGIEKSTSSFQNAVFMPADTAQKTSTVIQKEKKENLHDIQSVGISLPGSFDLERFNYWIESYLFFNNKNVFRIKGILSFQDMPEKQIFQAVGPSYVVEKGSAWENEPRFCKLVFIGKYLVREDLDWALRRLQRL